jgi:nitrite reductase/ring-hydroxylating ferredoxin subunit
MEPPATGRRYPMIAAPNGWYFIMRSDELRPKQVTPLRRFGQDIVAFRGDTGIVGVVDAFCPHLGAHLGLGGKVSGGEIVCPYHEWAFGPDGRCTRVFGTNKVPRTGVYAWSVVERNGLIFVYYHAERKSPDYEMPVLAEYRAAGWSGYEQLSLTTTGHVLELQENLVDEAHFVTIHRRREPLEWTFQEEGRRAVATAKMRVGVGGVLLTFDVRAEFHGPGMVVLRTRGIFDHTVLSMGTPIDDETADYRLLFLTKGPRLVPFASAVMNRFIRIYAKGDFLKEAHIWERRLYPSKPVYGPTDKTIPKFRSWYRQFSPPTSEERA